MTKVHSMQQTAKDDVWQERFKRQTYAIKETEAMEKARAILLKKFNGHRHKSVKRFSMGYAKPRTPKQFENTSINIPSMMNATAATKMRGHITHYGQELKDQLAAEEKRKLMEQIALSKCELGMNRQLVESMLILQSGKTQNTINVATRTSSVLPGSRALIQAESLLI